MQLSAGTAVGMYLPTSSPFAYVEHCLVVDNHRVLHGRSAFTGKRRMCGAYIGRDEYRSKLEVLAERFTPDVLTQERQKDVFNGRSIWSPYL